MRTGLTPAEALAIVLEEVRALPAETCAAAEAQGRVLAEAIRSERTLPPHDNSAMDGYALRATEAAAAAGGAPARLRVAFEVPAGAERTRELGAGEAARVLTGAAIPRGADAVVRQEDTEREGDSLIVQVAPQPGEHIRRAGEDVARGDRVLEPGTPLGPAQLGLLASLGRSVVAVHQRPRVAILSGGDELVEPDGDASGGRIVSSNSWSIAAACRVLGAEPVYLGIARDTPADVERHLEAGLSCDLLVSSAGVSVGDRDYVRGALEKLGCRLLFWGVEMKPGYPLAFGRFESERGPRVFGLPGNPVSALVTFEQFVRPALRKMTGHRSWFRPLLSARLVEDLRKKPGRLHFVRVCLERRDGEWLARSTGNQSSGVLRSMARAHGLLIFPAEAERLRAGESVSVQVLDPELLASGTPGF